MFVYVVVCVMLLCVGLLLLRQICQCLSDACASIDQAVVGVRS